MPLFSTPQSHKMAFTTLDRQVVAPKKNTTDKVIRVSCVSQTRGKRVFLVCDKSCDKNFMFLFWKVFVNTAILEDLNLLERLVFSDFS